MKKTILNLLLPLLYSTITFLPSFYGQISDSAALQFSSSPLFTESDELITLQIELDPNDFIRIYKLYRQDLWIPAEIKLKSGNCIAVRARLRGDSSRKLKKKSLKVALPKDVRLLSNSRMMNLNAEVSDVTFMRQYLATKLFQESGQTCFNSRHVLLDINGRFDGIYLWIENVDKAFLKQRKLNSSNLLYKATRDGANLSISDSSMNWECKNGKEETPFAALELLREEINAIPDSLYYQWARKNFEYESMINILSMNMLISNSSTYYHNYYLYRDLKSKKWQMWPWDLDKTFCLDKLDMHYHRGSHRERRSASLPGNPIMERAIICEPIFRDIQRRTHELSESIFNLEYVAPIIDSLEKELLAYVEHDTRCGQTIPTFCSEVDSLRKFFIRRYENLIYQFEHFPKSFTIHRPKNPFDGDVTLTWEPSIDPDGDSLVYNVKFCSDARFKDEIITIKNLIVPSCTIDRTSLEPGKYYFKVSVSDGKHKIYGYDSRHSFTVN